MFQKYTVKYNFKDASLIDPDKKLFKYIAAVCNDFSKRSYIKGGKFEIALNRGFEARVEIFDYPVIPF